MRIKINILGLVTVLAGCVGLSSALWAHHASRAVYESKTVTLKGTVLKYEWSNPHAIVSVRVQPDSGKPEEWHAEILPPAEMTRAGWTKESLKPGEEVTLTGRPGKYSQHIMWLEYVVTPDGKKLGRMP